MNQGRRRQAGFSLLESVISLMLAISVFTMVTPAFSRLNKSTLLESHAELLLSHLTFAREMSAMSGKRIQLCPRGDSGGCGEHRDWSKGWLLFVDSDLNRRFDGSDEVLKSHRLGLTNTVLHFRKRPNYIYFKPSGSAWPNGTFRFCDKTGLVEGSAVIVSMSGRPRRPMPLEPHPRC